MAEAAVVAACVTALEDLDCIVYNMHGSQYGKAGMPDLLIIRPDGQTAYVEVKQPGRTDKTAGNGLSALQMRWLWHAACRGVICGHCDSANDCVSIVFARPLRPL